MTFSLTAIGVSHGVAIGQAYIRSDERIRITRRSVAAEQVEQEVARFERGIKQARRELQQIRARIPVSTAAEIVSFIEAHLLMMDDMALVDIPISHIRQRKYSAEWAIKHQRDALVKVFDQMDDPYLRTRKDDIDHVVNRVIRALQHRHEPYHGSHSLSGKIIVARDLSPADILHLKQQGITAFVTERGGANSHAAILARSLAIPAVVGAHDVRRRITQYERLVVDGSHGVVSADFGQMLVNQVRAGQRRDKHRRMALHRLRKQPAVTADGQEITLMANIGSPADIPLIQRNGADGVGLFRTELLFLNQARLPSEEEQYRVYRTVVERLGTKTLTIRTADLNAGTLRRGGQFAAGPNPALGLRGIRYGLRETDFLVTQLRAICRAGAYGPVRILIPMISTMKELLQVKIIIAEVMSDCCHPDHSGTPRIPVGAMIEVPAAAMMAGAFAEALDFLSIGTNDLVQYTLAVDRLNEEVESLYDPLDPAVISLIKGVVSAGKAAAIPVEICGELASDRRAVRLLLGIGLRIFSMHPALVPEVKQIVRSTDLKQIEILVQQLGSTLLPAERNELLTRITCVE